MSFLDDLKKKKEAELDQRKQEISPKVECYRLISVFHEQAVPEIQARIDNSTYGQKNEFQLEEYNYRSHLKLAISLGAVLRMTVQAGTYHTFKQKGLGGEYLEFSEDWGSGDTTDFVIFYRTSINSISLPVLIFLEADPQIRKAYGLPRQSKDEVYRCIWRENQDTEKVIRAILSLFEGKIVPSEFRRPIGWMPWTG